MGKKPIKLRMDLVAKITPKDLLEGVLANSHRYKPEPLLATTGKGYLAPTTPEDRERELRRIRTLQRKYMSTKTGSDGMQFLDAITGKDPEIRTLIAEETKNLRLAKAAYELRTKAGLSQAELAKRLGTTQSEISRMEDADLNDPLPVLRRIMEVLDPYACEPGKEKEAANRRFCEHLRENPEEFSEEIFVRRLFEVLRRGFVSRRKAASVLKMDLEDLERYLGGFGYDTNEL